MKNLSKIFVTLFGVGFFPVASGTLASALTVVFWYFYIQFFTILSFLILILLISVLSYFLVKVYISDHMDDDPGEIVIDELIGQSLPLLFLDSNTDFFLILFVFICFRIFDIYKIYPVNLGEKINGSLGVIADDIIAGIYTIIFLMIYKIIII